MHTVTRGFADFVPLSLMPCFCFKCVFDWPYPAILKYLDFYAAFHQVNFLPFSWLFTPGSIHILEHSDFIRYLYLTSTAQI